MNPLLPRPPLQIAEGLQPPTKRPNVGPPSGQPSPETLFKNALKEHIRINIQNSLFQTIVDDLDLTKIGDDSQQDNFFTHIIQESLDDTGPIKTLIVDLDNVSYFVKNIAPDNIIKNKNRYKKIIRGSFKKNVDPTLLPSYEPTLDPRFETQSPTLKEDDIYNHRQQQTIIDSYRIPAFLILNYAVTNEYENIIIVAKDTNQKNNFVAVLTKIIHDGICANTGNVDEKSEVVSPNNVREHPFVFKQTIDCSTIQAAFHTRGYKCIIVQCNFTRILQNDFTYTKLEKEYVHDLKSGDDLVILQILFGLLDNGFVADNIKIMTNDCNSIRDYLASIVRVNQIRDQRFKALFKAFILPFTITCKTYTYNSIITNQDPPKTDFFINFAKNFIYKDTDNYTPIDQSEFNRSFQIQTTDELFSDYYFMPSSAASGQRNWVLETNKPFGAGNKKITYVKRNTTEPTIEIPYVTSYQSRFKPTLKLDNTTPFFQPDGITPLYLDNINDEHGNSLLIPYVTYNGSIWSPSLKLDNTPYTNTFDHIATITVPMDPYYTKYLKYKQKYQELKNKLNKN